MKKILFIGAYGIENAGDDLPMLVMMDNLKKLSPKTEFEFHALTRHVNHWDQEKYGVTYHQNLEYENREEAQGKWFRGLNYDDERTIFTDLMALINTMDLLIIGAGNFIIDISIDIFKGPIPLIWWYIHLAKLQDKKVLLYGISSAPLTNEYSKLLTKEIMTRSDVVTVRDSSSKQYLRSLNIKKEITVLPDPTLGFTPINTISTESFNKKLSIAIGLRSLDFLGDKGANTYQAIIKFINANPEHHYIFVPQSTYNEDNDIVLAQKIDTQLNSNIHREVITMRKTPQQLIQVYATCDVTIAIRLHSAVFSQIAATPAIAINYLPKVKAYMEDFGTINQTIELDQLSADELSTKVNEIQKNNSLKPLLVKKNREKKQQVEQYAKLALMLLADCH